MKKFAAIAVAASMFALAACGEKAAEDTTTTEAPAADATAEAGADAAAAGADAAAARSEEHTSELQSLMRISYAVFCLKKKKQNTHNPSTSTHKSISTTFHY